MIEVAFNQGVHPKKGFELILDHYGTCSAITAFESLPPDEGVRVACADRLVRRLHDDLTANLRGEIARRGQPLPPEGTSISGLIEAREWLFVGRFLPPRRLPSFLNGSALPIADGPLDDRPGRGPDRLRPEPLRAASLRR